MHHYTEFKIIETYNLIDELRIMRKMLKADRILKSRTLLSNSKIVLLTFERDAM